MNNKKQQLREVSIEDFDIALLRRAAHEGRLFIAPEGSTPEKQTTENRKQLVTCILDYVQPIAAYSSCPRVGDIWDAVLNDDRLAPLFFFSRYRDSRGKVNWYRVTALVCFMRENGIYSGYTSPTTTLHPRRHRASHQPLYWYEPLSLRTRSDKDFARDSE